jgi:GT2 family glycosyltransferase
MAFRKGVFEKYGGFRTDLGASPNREIPKCNEDTEFGRRLLAAGEHLRYEPSAVVLHCVTEERLRKDYFLTAYFDYGRASVREIGKRCDIWGIPRRYISIAKIIGTVGVRRTLRWILAMNPQRRFFNKAQVWKTAGEIVEIYRQR